ncbi:MAG: hypothetical protein L0G23_00430 [Ruaniaceae bacterium]|nr:hypothetical protein [Ruaniaceae bacterium]
MGRLALIGVPGSGKSAVGRALARALDVPFVDVADELGGPGAVVDSGEDEATRLAERIAAAADVDAVIAMPSWCTHGPQSARTVYLVANAAESFARSGMNIAGPVGLVNPRSMWALLLRERDPEYRAAADLVIDVSGKSISEVSGEVLAHLR